MPRVLLGAAFLALAAAGCRRGGSVVSRGAPIVLISVDTLRADHLPAYGYTAVETPNLDSLRKDAVLFENAYSHVPLTLPSHTTIFTGLLPPQNGVRDNLGYTLGPGPATIASLLKARGYATGGAVSSIVLSHATGISRGFDFWEDDVEPTKINQSMSRVQRNGAVTEAALDGWVGEHAKGPFFAFLHLFEPHTPYEPPEPYLSRYKLPYDGEIALADEIVGRFLKSLKDRGLYDNSLIVFLSDHGEGLNDHGEDEHGVLLYREEIHVPLLVKFPGSRRAGETEHGPVSLTDVLPTIAEVAGLEVPAGLAGRSLASSRPEEAARRIYSETLYPRLHLGWSDLASLTDDKNQYIHSPKPELYDIVADPGERKDLAAGLPPAFRSLSAELAKMPRPLQAPGNSDPEQVKKLAALGYISASSADLTSKNLPAPQDRIGAVAKLKDGFGAHAGRPLPGGGGDLPGAACDGSGNDGCLAALLGRLHEARPRRGSAPALQEAAKLSPGNPQVLLALADYYLATATTRRRRRHAELVGDAGTDEPAREPGADRARRGRPRRGRAGVARRAGEVSAARVPRLILGRVRHDKHGTASARSRSSTSRGPPARCRVTVAAPEPELSARRLPRAPGSRGRGGGGLPAGDPRLSGQRRGARPGLAMLYASEGREAEARKALRILVTQLHTPDAYFAAIRTYEILGDPATAAELKAQARSLFPEGEGAQGRGRIDGARVRRLIFAQVSPPTSLPAPAIPSIRASSGPTSARVPPERKAPSLRAEDERHRVGRVRRVRLAGRRDRASARRCRGRPSSGAARRPRGMPLRGFRSTGRASRRRRSSRGACPCGRPCRRWRS